MRNASSIDSNFTIKTFLAATLPAYIFPALMSWGAGWLMENEVLMASSFVSIALPSLVATIVTYVILWQMEVQEKGMKNKYIKTSIILGITIGIAFAIILLFHWQRFIFDIIFSTMLGTVITAWRLPVKQNENYEY